MQLVGETYSEDKTGAATAVVSYHVPANGGPIFGNLPSNFRGMPRTKAESKQQQDGSYVATGTYEGRSVEIGGGGGGGGGGDDKDRGGGGSVIYEWSPTFEQTDIAKHPRIDFLLDTYDGQIDDAGNVIWPKELNSAGDGGLDQNRQENSDSTNPMYGVTEFLSLGGVWSQTALEGSLPDDVFSSIGTIALSVPGGLPTPENRFWLTMPPIVVEHGDYWKVTRRWMLSGIASARDVKAAQDIYTPQQG